MISTFYRSRLAPYVALTRLNRPVGIYLVLWPALWALWLASGEVPQGWLLFVFVAGAIVMRSAGCVINDYADRHLDGHVRRTCDRPLACGQISSAQALRFFALLCLLGFTLVLTLNSLTVWLSLGALALAALYPFMKRYTHWPQLFLGMAFAWAVPMAFAAVQAEVPWQAWPLFAATVVWSLIYDTAYAVTDREDDQKIGIKSTAILFGRHLVAWIAFFQTAMLALLLWTGSLFAMGGLYYLSLALVAVLFGYHLFELKDRDPQRAFRVFLQNHWLGVIVLLGIVSDQAWSNLG